MMEFIIFYIIGCWTVCGLSSFLFMVHLSDKEDGDNSITHKIGECVGALVLLLFIWPLMLFCPMIPHDGKDRSLVELVLLWRIW
jgi:hypothetical protein